MREMAPAAWTQWDADAWGIALLAHYFAGDDGQPVSRLAISTEELADAAQAPASDAASVRDAFLTAIQCSPREFRRRLSGASLSPHTWNRDNPPPFLAHLFFTCFAAAELGPETADENVFRERLRQLLDHKEGTTYALDHLSLLWESFAKWLEERRNAGESYRALRLPERGRMTLIGYSVKLAFPRREDRLRLRIVLAEANLGPLLTIPEAFRLVALSRDHFSADFRSVFERARSTLVKGTDSSELQAVWSAILEASAVAPRSERRTERVRYQLFAMEDDLGRVEPFIVVDRLPAGQVRSSQFLRLDEPLGDFNYFVSSPDGGTDVIAQLLLLGALDERLAGFASSPVSRAVEDGVLLFRRMDSATWELAVTRPIEGRVRAVVRSELSRSFGRLFREPPDFRPARFDGWLEFRGFDITTLRVSNSRELESVRCLQLVEIGPQVHLCGGIRVEGGYLGLEGLLPEVQCADAEDTLLLHSPAEFEERRSIHVVTLLRLDRPGYFGWPAGHGDLDGAYVLAGSRDGRIVASRKVRFHSRVLSHQYEQPTYPDRWLLESGNVDVTPASTASDVFLTTERECPVLQQAMQPLRDISPPLTQQSVDDKREHDRLVETLAAISLARKGITEGDIVDAFKRIVRPADGAPIWDIIRGWLEAGYIDCLTRRQWRGRVYFARKPRFVLIRSADSTFVRVVLHGLAPLRLRTAVRAAFASRGIPELTASSLSPFVPAPQAWLFETYESASAAIAEFGELGSSSPTLPADLAGDFDVAMSDTSSPPPGYERLRAWDWTVGGFRKFSESSQRHGVRIEHLTRATGPDRYVVVADGEQRTTISRTWALLYGYRLAGMTAFAADGPLSVVRQGADGPLIPLPIARTISLRAGIVGGPSQSAAFGAHYAYAVESSSVQRWLLAWLNGRNTHDSVARRLAWLCAATPSPRPGAIQLPAHLRRRLLDLEISDAVSLANRRVLPSLIAHIRHALELTDA